MIAYAVPELESPNKGLGQALKVANQYQKLTDYVYDSQRQTVISFAKTAFYQTLFLKKVWEVAQESEENARENYEIMKRKYDNGVISKLQLLQPEVRWENIYKSSKELRVGLE